MKGRGGVGEYGKLMFSFPPHFRERIEFIIFCFFICLIWAFAQTLAYRSTKIFMFMSITIDEVLTIAEEVATSLFEKLTDDGKLSVIDCIQLAILLIRLIAKAVKD